MYMLHLIHLFRIIKEFINNCDVPALDCVHEENDRSSGGEAAVEVAPVRRIQQTRGRHEENGGEL